MRINNNNYQKNANISLVSRMIWRRGAISRVEIARQLQLYRSTVTSIVSFLLENNVVVEAEEGASMSKGGRRPITLRLNGSFGVVVGFDVQPSHYRAVIVDITGTSLWHRSGNLPKVDFDGILDYLMDLVLPEIERLGLPLLAVSVGVPGIVDSDGGRIIYAEPFKIHDYDLLGYFSAHYRTLALVENDANCTTWLEMALNRNLDLGSFLSIIADYHERNELFSDKSGIGVGIGLCLGGKVYGGSHHASGEIRTLSWRADSAGQNGLSRDLFVDSSHDDRAWTMWMEDFFASLVPVLSVIDPTVLFIHGKPFADRKRMDSFFASSCPQVPALLEKMGCRMVFNTEDDTVVADGAAMMFLEKLFRVPDLSEMESRCHLTWDTVLAQAAHPVKRGYRKGGEE